jgi:hypothetical protein
LPIASDLQADCRTVAWGGGAAASRRFKQSKAEADASVTHAFTPSPEVGDPPGTASTVSFTADPPGDYYLACGVPVHLMDDMYLRFWISDEVFTAEAVLDEALVPKDALAVRP